MTNRKRVLLLSVLIMTGVALVVGAIALFGLYRTAFEQQRERLVETVRSRARLIEAIARFDATYSATDMPGGPEAATLSQVARAHEQFRGFGETGEFTLARREGDQIVFLLRHRHSDLDNPRPVPLDSEVAEPMRRALSGQSGTVIGLDYRGERVLAAYEFIGVVDWGVVGKIDLAEIRRVFVRAGVAASSAGLVVVIVGAILFLRTADPLIGRLEQSETRLLDAQRVARMGSWDWNIVTNDLHWSDETYRIFGLSPQEFGATYEAFLASVHPDDRESMQQHVDAAVHDNAEYHIDHRIVLPSGKVRHVHEQGEVTRDANGAPLRMLGTVTDITERKRAEEARQESEARHRQLFATVSDAIMVFDGETLRFVDVNDAALQLYGYSREEFLKLRQPDLTAELEESVASIEQALAGKLTRVPLRYHKKKDGSVFPVEISVSALTLGGRRMLCGVVRDITERKQAEEAVREHARLLEAFFRYSLTATVFLDRDFNFIRVNEAYARACQREVSEFPGHNHFEFYPSDAQKIFEEVRDTKIPFQTFARPFVYPDHPEWGVTYWDWTLVPILDDAGEVELLVFSLSDVTKRKRTEEAHRLDEARLEALVRLNEMAEAPFQEVADFALEEAIKVTRSEMGFVGFMSDDESQMHIHAWSASAMRECAVADKPIVFPVAEAGLWGEIIRQRKPIVVNDYAALETWKKGYPEGHVHVSRFLGIPVFDGERIVAVAAVANKEEEYQGGDVRQLTLLMDGMWRLIQRQRAEAAVRESRRFLQTIIDDIPEALMVIDRDYRIVLANRVVKEMAGGRDPVSGCLTCYQASHHRLAPCSEEEHPCPLRQVISSKAPVTVMHTHFDADGNELLMEVFAAPIFDETGNVVQVIEACRDITVRVRAEEQARQRQAELAHVARLGTMGEMAAGLAHELNQPLSAIVNYVQACLERIQSGAGDPNELLSDMEQTATQAQRAGEIIERIRKFVGKPETRRTAVDPNTLVREAADLMKTELRRNEVQLILDLTDPLPKVEADSIQIEQVIVNLIRNGMEAMSETGGDGRRLVIQTLSAGHDAVECAISDTGPGLSAEVGAQAFDPFFTTKPDGMGMGLSICRTIIEAHRGRLWATPNPERGATFRFTLPVEGGGLRGES